MMICPKMMLLAASCCVVAAAYTNIGRCGVAPSGRWGEDKREQVFFMKTHKTAGSSLRELFIRFAVQGGKRILRTNLPGGKLCTQAGMSSAWVPAKHMWPPRTAGAMYDVAFDHSTFDRQRLSEYMPNASLVTVSREPLARVVSACAFFHGEATPAACLAALDKACGDPLQNQIWNSIAWHFRVEAAEQRINFCDKRSPAAVARKLDSVDLSQTLQDIEGASGFFVMLTERLDESLVLLRSLHCWRWADVVMPGPPLQQQLQKHTERKSFQKQDQQRPAMPDGLLKARLLALNRLDIHIHNASVRKFETLVERYGGELQLANDVAFLRRYQLALAVACLTCSKEDPPGSFLPSLHDLSCDDLSCICGALLCQLCNALNDFHPNAPLRRLRAPPTHGRVPRARSAEPLCPSAAGPECMKSQERLERVMVDVVASCARADMFRAAEVCSIGRTELCRKGEVCVQGLPEQFSGDVLRSPTVRITFL